MMRLPLQYTYKRLLLLSLLLGSSLFVFADFIEDFSDGNYTDNPTWVGDTDKFIVNRWGQLQSKATETATSYLSTESEINEAAEWLFFCQIATTPTAYNHMRFYPISSEENPLLGTGWYVQVGGKDKHITLGRQVAGAEETVISNTVRKGILDAAQNKVWVRVRLVSGVFSLETRVDGVDTDYFLEGEYVAERVGESKYFSIVVRNTSKTGTYYYADDIRAQGETIFPDENGTNEPQDGVIVAKDGVYLTQDYFSPNGDGTDDECQVHYRLPSAGFSAQIRIFTANGLLVRTLQSDGVLPAEGYLVWDGTDAEGDSVAIGVYVILCEMTHTQTGQILRKKLPIAVLL